MTITTLASRIRHHLGSSIQLKMLVYLGCSTLLAASVPGWITLRYLHAHERDLLENYQRERVVDRAGSLGREMEILSHHALLTARVLTDNPQLGADKLYQLTRANVELAPLIFGSAIAFAPYAFDARRRLFAPYTVRHAGTLAAFDLGDIGTASGYDYQDGSWPWWSAAVASNTARWSEPFLDNGAGGVMMSTFSAPFYRDGELRGVATIDIYLQQLFSNLGLSSMSELIINGAGRIIYSTEADRIMRDSVYDLEPHYAAVDLDQLLAQAQRQGAGNFVLVDPDNGEKVWGIFGQIPQTDWYYLELTPEREALSLIYRLERTLQLVFVFALLVLMGVIWFITRRLTKPIEILSSAARQVTQGDFRVNLPPESGDELGSLAGDFKRMIAVLARKTDEWEQRLGERTAQLLASEQAVLEQKTVLENALDGVDIGVMMYDSTLRLLIANSKLREVLGISAAEMDGFADVAAFKRHLFETRVEEPFDWQQIKRRLLSQSRATAQLTLRSGAVIALSHNALGDGRYIECFEDISAQVSARRALEDKLREVAEAKRATLNMMQDTEEARQQIQRSEEKLREQLVFVQALLDTIPNPLFYKDAQTRFLGVNSAYETAFGVKAADLIGLRVSDLEYLPEEDRQRFQAEDEEIIRTSGLAHHEITLAFADGKLHDTLYWVSGFSQADGSPGGLIGTLIDISQQKEAAKQLAIARDKAEAATRAKANFLASMSHEIRTPMNAVIGMVDLLKQTQLTEEQSEMLHTVSLAGQSLLAIINDILDLSKIESGKMGLESISFSLAQAVEDAASTASVGAHTKGLSLLTFVDPQLPVCLFGDPVRLRQILVNLIGNAIKFTDEGAIFIRATLRERDAQGRVTVLLSVKDYGIGIAKEVQQGLFDEFAQAESSTTRKYGGTGLGLSICKRLTDMMGGHIWVESELGKGSEFLVTFTLEEDPAPCGPPPPAADTLQGVKILLVDSDGEARDLIMRTLRSWQATLTQCATSAQGLALCRESCAQDTPFDLVILGSALSPSERFSFASQAGEGRRISTRFLALVVGQRRQPRITTNDTLTLDTSPLTGSSLLNAISIALGRISPVVHHPEEEDLHAQHRVLSVEEAEAAGSLILVAEDNATNRDVIGRQLHLLGHTYEMTENGQLALAAWRSGRYALLLADCHMPEMDGFELTAAIRADEAASQTGRRAPIIAITANALRGEEERCLAAGMDAYLAKPVDLKQLRRTLARYLKLAPAETPAPVALAAAPVPSSAAAVDDTVLKGMFGDDQETFREILSDFVAPSQAIVADMHAAGSDASAAGLQRAAHKLKSAAKSIGAHALAELCLQLEQAGREAQLDDIAARLAELDTAMAAVVDYIAALE